MEQTTLRRALPKSTAHTIRFHLPIYVLIPFYLFVGILMITVSCIILARREAPPDPFSAYASVLSGQLDPSMICNAVRHVGDEENGIVARYECSSFAQSGPFSRVTVVIGEGSYSAYFTIRDRAVTLGDLGLLWGKPDLEQLSERMTSLTWPDREISAWVRQSDGGRFNYFLSPVMVFFRSIPQDS
jgi:hypothetical protein